MFTIVTTQHRGKPREQQDALFDGTRVVQSINHSVSSRTHDTDGLLFAVADGVAVSPRPELACRYLMDMLAQTQSDPIF